MPLDRALLVKLLQTTTSSNDAEALVAIRKANDILRIAGVQWTGLISGSRAAVSRRDDPPHFVRRSPTRDVTGAFELLEERDAMDDYFRIMRDQWRRKKWLHPSDHARLFRKVEELEP